MPTSYRRGRAELIVFRLLRRDISAADHSMPYPSAMAEFAAFYRRKRYGFRTAAIGILRPHLRQQRELVCSDRPRRSIAAAKGGQRWQEKCSLVSACC